MATYFCVYCGRMTTHLNIQAAAAAAQVARTTMYKRIRRALVHAGGGGDSPWATHDRRRRLNCALNVS
ncbi:MAG: hypothetical protein B7Z68_01880 [Acidobacteria bacterium 21-70-11]|nr:MAG: hypothetical protein B7Z68_01880 [Acidobacteria bacterium 21-70-11]OYW06687.1 MAG: hypothetical protein B7Z61_01565 [Acidobacteria bacterium 37-71-11]HQT94582.1 hypothetical protein [Thermoanaerobaculaceae bacterium]